MKLNIVNHGPHDGTHSLYDVVFFTDTISTIVTCTPSYVDSWISEIERLHHDSLIVGLDVEWRPDLCRYCNNPVATLQLCVGNSCLIFQILHSPIIPWSLANFLRNPNYTFTGVGIDEDVKKLMEDYYLEVTTTVDLRLFAAEKFGEKELKNSGLKQLTRRVLGKEMSKKKCITMSRWDNPWLDVAQVSTFLRLYGAKVANGLPTLVVGNHEYRPGVHAIEARQPSHANPLATKRKEREGSEAVIYAERVVHWLAPPKVPTTPFKLDVEVSRSAGPQILWLAPSNILKINI